MPTAGLVGFRDVRRTWLLAAATMVLVGCGSTVVTHTVTVGRKPHVLPADTTPAPHVGTGPPTGAGTNDCGTIDGERVYGDAATSCGFARSVYRAAEAFYRTVGADAAHLRAYSPATRRSYRLACEINSADQVNCSTGTGAMVSFQAFTTPPEAPPAAADEGGVGGDATTSDAPPPTPQAGPDRALCHDLYDQWRAGDAGSQAAIEQYAQMGCDQAPRTDGNTWCKTFTATTADGGLQRQAVCDSPPGTPGASPPGG